MEYAKSWWNWAAIGSAAATLVTATAGGCANQSLPPPVTPAQVASAESTVVAAREAGTANDEASSRPYRLAEQQLSQAKEAIASGDNRNGSMLLARATADAELATTLGRQARTASELKITEQEIANVRAASAKAANAQTIPAAPSGLAASPSAGDANATGGSMGQAIIPAATPKWSAVPSSAALPTSISIAPPRPAGAPGSPLTPGSAKSAATPASVGSAEAPSRPAAP